MTHVSYSVTESIYRRYGRIVKLVYDYEENQEQFELDLLPQKQDHIPQYRHYRATIKRDEYERRIQTYMSDKDNLSFDNFVRILRPIMMGTYVGNELQEAFYLLDKDQSNTIDIDELTDFLSIIHSEITKEILLHYVGKIDIHTDQKLNFDEFTDMILRGIGRDIVCGHI
jgi:Ca2+-binding EF-hand superfamily protein